MNSYDPTSPAYNEDADGPRVVCPFCKNDLDYEGKKPQCRKCGSIFPEQNGILCFGTEDAFYEGKFTESKDWSLGEKNGIKKIIKAVYRSISIGPLKPGFSQGNSRKLFRTIKPVFSTLVAGGGQRFCRNMGT